MATVFYPQYKEFLLNQMETFGNSPTGLCVVAYSGSGGTGTVLASAIITFGAPSGVLSARRREATNMPVLTVSGGNIVYSLGLASYKGAVGTNLNLIGFVNTVNPTVDYNFETTGVIKIDYAVVALHDN